MGSGLLRLQDELLIELLGALAAVFEHGAHGCVAVDVAVFTFDVGVNGVGKGELLVNSHQTGVHLAHTAALGAVQNIVFGHHVVPVVHEHALHNILNVFHRRRGVGEDLPQPLLDLG